MSKPYLFAVSLIATLLLPFALTAQDETDLEAGGEPDAEDDGPAIDVSFANDSSGWAFGISPRIGLDIPTSELNPFLVLGLEFDVFFPVLDNRLVGAVDFSFTYPREDGSGTDARVSSDYDWETKVLELKFTIDGIWRFFDRSHNLIPFAGLGLGLQYLRTAQSTDIDDETNTERNAEFAFEILGGLDWKLGIGYLFGDVRFVISDLNHRFTGDINAGNVTICAGYRFVF